MKKTKKLASKKATEPRKHEPIPFEKIAKLYQEGKSMEQIAKATNRWNAASPDGSKSLRAIVSNMITKGYRNKEGKLVRLKKRPRVKLEPKAVKKATRKVIAKKPQPKKQDVKAREQKPEPKPPSEPKPEAAPSAVSVG